MKKTLLVAPLFLIALLGSCASKQPGVKTKDEMTDFATRYAQAWSSGDPNSVAVFYAENASLQVNDNKPAVRRLAIVNVARGFMTTFPEMVISIDKVCRERQLDRVSLDA